VIDTTSQQSIRLGGFCSPTASLNLTAAGAYHGPSAHSVSDLIRQSAAHFLHNLPFTQERENSYQDCGNPLRTNEGNYCSVLLGFSLLTRHSFVRGWCFIHNLICGPSIERTEGYWILSILESLSDQKNPCESRVSPILDLCESEDIRDGMQLE
jgi:hypothetical protein